MALDLPDLGWSRYRDANPVPISPLGNDIATAPTGPVQRTIAEYVLTG